MRAVVTFIKNCLQLRVVLPLLLTFAWGATALYWSGNIVQAVISTAYLLTMPGYVLYRTIVGYPRYEIKAVRTLGYVVGLSLVVLMLLGLGVNQIAPMLGWSPPLIVPNLVFAIGGFTTLFTLTTALRSRRQNIRKYLPLLTWQSWQQRPPTFWWIVGLGAALLLLPVLAVGGAVMLNNGGSNWLALTTMALCAAAMLGLAWSGRSTVQNLYPVGLYGICLALLLGTSMRGWEITGHDVMQEFQVFQLTSQAAQWSMSLYQDAYTACLSITILPTIFERLTGMHDPYIFKFLFQVIFALIAPLLYVSLRGYVPRKVAFLAALLFITFPTFLTDIMMLNRQEIAILCFTLGITAGLDRQLSRLARHVLMIVFFGGMVLSHYATSYIAISTLIVAVGLGFLLWLIRPWLERRLGDVRTLHSSSFTVVPVYIVVLVALMIVGWSGFATNTAGNVFQRLGAVGGDITRILTHVPGTQKTVEPAAEGTLLEQYVEEVRQKRPLPASEYYDDADLAGSSPREIIPDNAEITSDARTLGATPGGLTTFYTLVRQGYVALLGGLMLLGLYAMLLGKSAKRLPPQYTLLGIAGVVVVALQAVLPSDTVNYGLARVLQQALTVLALPIAVMGVLLLSPFKVSFKQRFRLAAVGVVVMFLFISSLIPTLTGGFRPALAFSNAGFYYEAYYTHTAEIEADRWLVANAPKGSRVYADEFSRRRLITYANIFAEPTLVPAAIPKDSYVYISKGNLMYGHVPVYHKGQLIFYGLPLEFLNKHKNIVYNSGDVIIYK